MRHYPLGDRLELDAAWLMADHPEGALLAQAERAFVTQDGQRMRLEGDVRLSRAATDTQPAFEARTTVLEVDTQAGRAWSTEPVQWTQGELQARAAGFDYVQTGAKLELKGPVRAQITAPPAVRR